MKPNDLHFVASCVLTSNDTYVYSEGVTPEIPISNSILTIGVPYRPIIYATHHVNGSIKFSHFIDGDPADTFEADNLLGLTIEPISKPGGETIQIFGPPIGDGVFFDEDCEDIVHGCKYEIPRTLSRYDDSDWHMDIEYKFPNSTSYLDIQHLSIYVSAGKPFVPEFYISYVRHETQSQQIGLIYFVIGLVILDLLPATMFYQFAKDYKPMLEEDEPVEANSFEMQETKKEQT